MRLSSEEHVLLLTMHHIISDGWSMGVLMREVAALYQGYSSGRQSAAGGVADPVCGLCGVAAEWLQGEVLEQQLAYWSEQLAGAPACWNLPTDRPRPAVQTFRGGRVRQSMSEELSERLKELSRREGVTLFMTLLAAFQVLLGATAGRRTSVVGTPIANRTRTEMEGLIGFFVEHAGAADGA